MSEGRAKPLSPGQVRLARVVIRIMSAANTWVYRLSGGRIGGRHRSLKARTATPEEKRAYWPRLTAMYRDFDDY